MEPAGDPAPFEDQAQPVVVGAEVEGIAGNRNEVGEPPGCDAAAVGEPQELSRAARGGDQDLLGCHPGTLHQGEFAWVGAVRDDAGVGAEGDAYPGADCPSKHLFVAGDDLARLGHNRVGKARRGKHTVWCDQGRNEPSAGGAHELEAFVVGVDAVFDRANTGAKWSVYSPDSESSVNSEYSPLSERYNEGRWIVGDATAVGLPGTVENFGIEIGNAMGWPPMAGRVLATLMLHDGPMSMKQLREALDASAGTISEMARLLDRNGVVTRVKIPNTRQTG